MEKANVVIAGCDVEELGSVEAFWLGYETACVYGEYVRLCGFGSDAMVMVTEVSASNAEAIAKQYQMRGHGVSLSWVDDDTKRLEVRFANFRR